MTQFVQGQPCLALYTDGEYYPAVYHRERSTGAHQIDWADGSGRGETAEICEMHPEQATGPRRRHPVGQNDGYLIAEANNHLSQVEHHSSQFNHHNAIGHGMGAVDPTASDAAFHKRMARMHEKNLFTHYKAAGDLVGRLTTKKGAGKLLRRLSKADQLV